MPNPLHSTGPDTPDAVPAYDDAPTILAEMRWVTDQVAARPSGTGLSREFWLRKATLLDRIALRESAECTPADATESNAATATGGSAPRPVRPRARRRTARHGQRPRPAELPALAPELPPVRTPGVRGLAPYDLLNHSADTPSRHTKAAALPCKDTPPPWLPLTVPKDRPGAPSVTPELPPAQYGHRAADARR
ncbi:hypothetical protein [Streptomyces chrestomyceticus]|uniref:hypothetical protein n=1 Tax=Streptomyces chrestomyceticus TaxID=68185 RepID=UPI0033D194E8